MPVNEVLAKYMDPAMSAAPYSPVPVVAPLASLYGMGRDVQHMALGQPDAQGNPVTLPTLGTDAMGTLASLAGGKSGGRAIGEATKAMRGAGYSNAFSEAGKEAAQRASGISRMATAAWHEGLERVHMGNLPSAPNIIRGWINRLSDMVGPVEATAQIAKLTHGDTELSKEAGVALKQVIDPDFAMAWHNLQLPGVKEAADIATRKGAEEAPGRAMSALVNYLGSEGIRYGTEAVRKPLGDYMVGEGK